MLTLEVEFLVAIKLMVNQHNLQGKDGIEDSTSVDNLTIMIAIQLKRARGIV